jgi:hypothetical protein
MVSRVAGAVAGRRSPLGASVGSHSYSTDPPCRPERALHIAVDDLPRGSLFSTDAARGRRSPFATVSGSKEEVQ